jgi:hypothetical protein
MKKMCNFAVQKNRRNMLEKNELINQIVTRKKVNVFQDKTFKVKHKCVPLTKVKK